MTAEERFQSFADRYDSGSIPWDDPLPPPEILALAADLPAGHALDLGSGYGRAAIYLAEQGWTVDGVEYVPQAVAEATRRAAAAGQAERVRFMVGDVSRLDFLAGPYDLAIDVGCMHSLAAAEQAGYRDGLLRLLRPGATFLLFAHLRDGADPSPEAARWIADDDLGALFLEGFVLQEAVLGVTQVADNPPWRSGWFTYRRREARDAHE